VPQIIETEREYGLMPRSKPKPGAPSPGGRFMRQRGGGDSDQAIVLTDIISCGEVCDLIAEVLASGIAVQFSLTNDRRSVAVQFYDYPDRVVWYIQRPEDWQEMIQTVAL